MNRRFVALIVLGATLSFAQSKGSTSKAASTAQPQTQVSSPSIVDTVKQRPLQYESSAEFLNSKDALEQDALAQSVTRRDWLSDRLLFSLGTGAMYGAWGTSGLYFGFATEYVTRWPGGDWGNSGLFASYGYLPSQSDPAFPSAAKLQSTMDWRLGVHYQFLPKFAIHPGLAVSYGTAMYDFNAKLANAGQIVKSKGYNVDATVTYLPENNLYFILGLGYAYNGKLGTDKDGLQNLTVNQDNLKLGTVNYTNGFPAYDLKKPTFSFGVGYAFSNLFPDEVERKRRQREANRDRLGL